MNKYAPTILLLALSAACSSEPDPQDPSAVQPGYGQPGYGQPGYQQPGYGQPAATTTATAPAPAPAPATAATPGMSVPCESDSFCGTHKCNLTTRTCQFPCTSTLDCQAGSACMMGVCFPGSAQ